LKYDDAKWHYGGDFPKESPQAYGGTHVALFLRWCFLRGWAGDLHVAENPDDVDRMKRGELSATDFLFKWCDGKFTNEDLNSEGNAFAANYYGSDKTYLNDYAKAFPNKMYLADERSHDFSRFSAMVQSRYAAYIKSTRRPWWMLW